MGRRDKASGDRQAAKRRDENLSLLTAVEANRCSLLGLLTAVDLGVSLTLDWKGISWRISSWTCKQLASPRRFKAFAIALQAFSACCREYCWESLDGWQR